MKIRKIQGEKNHDAFGYSTAIGDVNGDGQNEIIVVTTNQPVGGSLKIYNHKLKHLKSLPLSKKKVNTIRIITKDINRDQIDEIIVGITYQDLSGEVKVFSYKMNKILLHLKSVEEFDAFGFTIASGDVDGDGIPDIIVGAPQPIQDGRGKVYVYSGKDGSLIRKFSSRVPRGNSDFGTSLAAADFNGDGEDEIIIGSPGNPEGEVYIYSGNHGWLMYKLTGDPGFGINVHVDQLEENGLPILFVTTKDLEGNRISAYQSPYFYPLFEFDNDEVDIGFGETMATGDLDGDGKKEIIVGAFDSPHKRKKYAGQVNIYSSEDGSLLHRWYGIEEKDQFGFSLAVGKLSANQKDNLLIGAPREILKKKGIVYIVSLDQK
ncbi:FG-GAP-like repeat-containing protein [Tepidibacillus fermentans]|uniref:FG-GAP repeat protein n=1 Tax=Tepidibacillus fermentans TaxID=1281767 RepID=A0A4R3KII7_9BACI|nr:FG-GAP-like repeat-containing protein [Tepidibacillus fermentans]TCS82491.1 FG-GAP repeat protein [Tepidibacillus fermentans]